MITGLGLVMVGSTSVLREERWFVMYNVHSSVNGIGLFPTSPDALSTLIPDFSVYTL